MEGVFSSPASGYRKAHLKEMGKEADCQPTLSALREIKSVSRGVLGGMGIRMTWREGYLANTETEIFKVLLGAAEVFGAQCRGASSSEGRETEFSSLKMRK